VNIPSGQHSDGIVRVEMFQVVPWRVYRFARVQ
jgi:hypothetical protein